MFIEAGAGTGKTHRLVETVVAEVMGGAQIDELLVITFTEKAAAELRDRIRRALGDRAMRGDLEAELARQAVDRLHDAPISTLHGYAQRVLSRHRIAAGLGRELERLDDFRAEERFAAHWDHMRHRIAADPILSECLARTLAVGTTMAVWRGIAAELDSQWDRAASWLAERVAVAVAGSAPPPLAPVDASAVIAAFHDAEVMALTVPDADRLSAFIRNELPRLRAELERAEGDDAATLFALAGALNSVARSGRQDVWRVHRADLARARALAGAAWPVLAAELYSAVTPLLAVLAEGAVDAAAARRRSGVATYHDLLVWAKELLVGDPTTRLTERARYRRVLIDEFQDTDPLQAELAIALAFAGDAGLAPGRGQAVALPLTEGAVPLEPGRLWVVGDPKQSIYRFRRADLTTYRRLQVLLADDGHEVLDVNRRTRPVVLAAVNDMFSKVFPSEANRALLGTSQVAHQPLAADRADTGLADSRLADAAHSLDGRNGTRPRGRPRSKPVGSVPVDGPGFATFGPHPAASWSPVTGGPEAAKEGEGRQIAALLADGIARWTVVDVDTGAVRPSRPGDVCVLLRSRSALAQLTEALADVGLAHRIESRGFTWESQEIADVVVVLRAIVHAADPASVLAALRSRTLACSDRELLEWHLAGRPWELPGPGVPAVPAVEGSVAEGLRWLASLRDRRWQLSVAEFVEAVIRERRLDLLGLEARRPRDALARLGVLIDGADRFVANDATATLADFVAWCEFQRDHQVLAAETIAAEPDDDAVRIMTVHAAKGLEFPIVVVAGLGHRTRAQPLSVRWSVGDNGRIEPVTRLAVRVNDQADDVEDAPEGAGTAVVGSSNVLRARTFKDLRTDDADEDRLEAQRLAYVACTRARDHLLLSLWSADKRSLLSDLIPAIPPGTAHVLPGPMSMSATVARETPSDTSARTTAVAETGERVASRRADWEDERAAWRTEVPAVRSRRPSELVEFNGQAAGSDDASEDGFRPIEADATRARRLGSAVHAVLAAWDDGMAASPALLSPAASRAAADHGVPDAADEIVTHVQTMLGHPTSQRAALRTGRLLRELVVMGTIDATVSVGSIDVAWEEDDRLVLADYKTERGDRAALDEHYRPQLDAYRALLAAATGRDVESAGVIHLGP